jgi:hypothetical protein
MVIGSLNVSQKDILSRGHFVLEEVLSFVTFFPDDVLSRHLSVSERFVSGRFIPRTFCPRTFFLGF